VEVYGVECMDLVHTHFTSGTFHLLEGVAISSSNKCMHECNYKPIGNAYAFQVHSSTPAYLPDPLSDFSKGLVPRLAYNTDVKVREGISGQ